jgi:hypothetical protein
MLAVQLSFVIGTTRSSGLIGDYKGKLCNFYKLTFRKVKFLRELIHGKKLSAKFG